MPGAPPRDTSARGPAPAVGTGVVRGRVVAGDTGLPLRRARVMLNSLGRGEPRVTLSDTDGAFAFDALPAGRYQLHASKARYVDGTLGARRPGAAGRPFELADGQTFDSVVLTLAAAGVITGRVLDDFGDIMPGVAVMPMRYRTINGERQLVSMGMGGRQATSDDTGTFRLYGLAPGTYYVSARAEEMNRMGPAVTDATVTGFAPTFYPGTPVADEAQPIEVVAGAEVVADVSLVAARLSSVSGFVVDPSGARASGGYVMTMQGGRSRGMGFGGGGGQIKPDGTFTVSGLAPGEYVLQARPIFGTNPMFEDYSTNRLERLATASVTVSGEPIAGLRLAVVDPIRIPVNVTFEDGAAEKPQRVMVSAQTERGTGGGMATMRDGRLSLDVVPGTYRLSVGTMGGQPWFAKRLTYRGREVEDDEVDITAEPGGRIDVLFTSRSSSVDGSVTDDSGKPVADYTVVMFPDDADLLRRGSFNRVRVARPDAQGRFRATHLRPGRYLAAAIPDAPIEDVYDPDFLEGLKRIAKPVGITEGASATVALTLAPLP
jgi:hypothetical protein